MRCWFLSLFLSAPSAAAFSIAAPAPRHSTRLALDLSQNAAESGILDAAGGGGGGGGFDFPSAMPEKPVRTVEESVLFSARDFVEAMTKSLGEGVEAPEELEKLRAAAEDDDEDEPVDANRLTWLIYELMLERGMRYDEDPETGTLTPTDFDIPSNLDIPEVKKEFAYLYGYGMNLIQKGMLTVEQVKESVEKRLIARTGLSPDKFDEWLGY